MLRRAAVALALFLVASADAADPAFDKALRESLAEVHNAGADLYNQGKDYAGAYRLYEGALRTSRPLLGHRPAAQKLIDDGLAAAGKEGEAARKAFLLHEAIEKVRAELKEPLKTAVEPKKTPEPEPKKTVPPEPKKTTPEPKKTPDPEPKKTTPEPKKSAPVDPPPAKKLDDPKAGGPTVKGVVTYKGQPVPKADVTFVSLDRPAVTAVATQTGPDGAYTIPLAAGRYAVTVAAGGKGPAVTPPRYATTDTSGLRVDVKAGANTFDIALQ